MMTERQQQTRFLTHAGALLLEYNESSAEIVRALTSAAKAFGEPQCVVAVRYLEIAVSLADEPPILRTVKEIRLNAAVRARIHDVLQQAERGGLDLTSAVNLLDRARDEAPRYPRALVAVMFGAAGASFARLLGADRGAIMVAALSTVAGLLARQELARRHFAVLTLPLTAAFLGTVIGGIAIRMGWTQSPDLLVLVPALMLVPGPHILNGLFDLVDHYLAMSIARLGHALWVLIASALGIVLAARVVLPLGELPSRSFDRPGLSLFSDMILAGVATCGFAAFFNVPWRELGLASIGGMAGHGVRYLALDSEFPLETASFLGGLTVGLISAAITASNRASIVAIAFAGTVTMIPGLSFYRALGGALRLARQGENATEPLTAATLGHACQALVVVSGLAMGVILGIRLVLRVSKSVQRRSDPAS